MTKALYKPTAYLKDQFDKNCIKTGRKDENNVSYTMSLETLNWFPFAFFAVFIGFES